jgi:ABC-2 family transporter
MKALLIIAADSVRALLHRRALLALMLALLGLTLSVGVVLNRAGGHISEALQKGRAGDSRAQAPQETESGKKTEQAPAGQGQQRSKASLEEAEETAGREMREMWEGIGTEVQVLYLFSASFGGSLVALFVFCNAVSSEIRKGTIRVTLAKPISRTQFLLGKFFGGLVVMGGYWILATTLLLAFVHLQQITLSPAMRAAPWLTLCQHLMLGSVGLVFSLYMHPVVAGVLAFFATAGWFSPPNPLYYILPSYEAYSSLGNVFLGNLTPLEDVAWLTLYALDFTIIVLLLALWRFRTQELL